MPIFEFGGTRPHVNEDAWVAPTAVLFGNVWMARGASIWFGAVLRGDNGPVRVGDGSNIQDLCVLHALPGKPTAVGRSCSVGHGAALHGCTIGDFCLIGMGTIVLDGATVGSNCVIGAGTLIPAGRIIPDNSLVIGHPGRIVRQLPANHAVEQRRKAFEYEVTWRRARSARAASVEAA